MLHDFDRRGSCPPQTLNVPGWGHSTLNSFHLMVTTMAAKMPVVTFLQDFPGLRSWGEAVLCTPALDMEAS